MGGAAAAAAMARWVCDGYGRCRRPPFIGSERGTLISGSMRNKLGRMLKTRAWTPGRGITDSMGEGMGGGNAG